LAVWREEIPVGAGLPAMTSAQQPLMLANPPLSRASPLPQGLRCLDSYLTEPYRLPDLAVLLVPACDKTADTQALNPS